MRKIFLLLIVLIGASFPILAWDDAGHKISAYIAWQRMTPQARERAAKILLAAPEDADLSVFYLQDSRSAEAKQRELFMIASTWADIVRDRKFKERYEKYHHGNWHYADTFWSVTNGKIEYLKDMEEGGKAVEKLYDFDKVLRDTSESDEEKAIALAWILHLGGDIHQPLHTSARVTELEPKGDQGGNTFLLNPKDTPRDKSENLHWFWDSIVGRNIARQNDACDADYLPPIANQMMKKHPFARMQNRLALGNFDEWQKQSFTLNPTDVFSPDLIRFQTPTAKYKRNAFRVAEQQITLAGYRLGEMLNQIFDNPTANIEEYRKQVEKGEAVIGKGVNDFWIWTKTRASLAKQSDLRNSAIIVDVDDSTVTLRGTVVSSKQKDLAENAVKSIEGIERVFNKLKIVKP